MKKFDDLMSVGSEIENISASDAKKKLNDPNVQFIDVRDKESFSKGTIGNAIHLDRGLLEFYADQEHDMGIDEISPEKKVILYCNAGGQAALAGKTLLEMGYKEVLNLGSFNNWEKFGGPTE